MKLKVLFIAPIPPPVTGQSLAVQVIKEYMEPTTHIDLVNLSKGLNNGIGSWIRIVEIFKILKSIYAKKNSTDTIYFTISESVAGNLKDLLIYFLCYNKLSTMIIHLHGGAGMKVIMEKDNWLTKINLFFLKKIGKILVLGNSLKSVYSELLQDKILIVPNFAEDYIFIDREDVYQKFGNIEIINVLFLSNLIYGKGYLELIDAYRMLKPEIQQKLRIQFAGGFESVKQEQSFLTAIQDLEGISYEGVVSGHEKKALLNKAHIFCLPTYYPYEGQPISILEAYASGCFVVTTNHSGIKDIFIDCINGYEVEKESSYSLSQTFNKICDEKEILLKIALKNRKIADEKYRVSLYNITLSNIINGEIRKD